MELKPGMYYRYKGIIGTYYKPDLGEPFFTNQHKYTYNEIANYGKFSHNIIDLIEYMDLLVIENKLKDIDNREIYLFNPVRCDGFTEFEGGKRCMIINMDYIIPIENIKVYQALTHEIFECNSYKVGD